MKVEDFLAWNDQMLILNGGDQGTNAPSIPELTSRIT